MKQDNEISFAKALTESEELFDLLDEQDLATEANCEKLRSLLANEASCRGLFVSLLTGDSKIIEQLPSYFLEELNASEHVPSLLAKNIVMANCMYVSHLRNKSVDNASGSHLVACRAASLVKAMKSDLVKNELQQMKLSIKLKTGVFADFLKRWNYDDEQLKAALEAIYELT